MLDNQYQIIKQLGKGGSSQVFQAKDIYGNDCAVKIIRKDRKYTQHQSEHFILRERIVFDIIGTHSNLVQSWYCSIDGVLEYGQTKTSVMYHVLELCPNGTLGHIIRRTGPLEEALAKFWFYQLACGVSHIHQNNFAHLDIKLENILLDEFFNLKLADLGTAYCVSKSNGLLNLQIGTPGYIAPEISKPNGEYYNAQNADIYSLGVCLFYLLTGEFSSASNGLVFWNTQSSGNSEDSEYSIQDFGTKSAKNMLKELKLSDSVTGLIISMLQYNPEKRPDIIQILEHHWFNDFDFAAASPAVYSEMQARKVTINSSAKKVTPVNFE